MGRKKDGSYWVLTAKFTNLQGDTIYEPIGFGKTQFSAQKSAENRLMKGITMTSVSGEPILRVPPMSDVEARNYIYEHGTLTDYETGRSEQPFYYIEELSLTNEELDRLARFSQ